MTIYTWSAWPAPQAVNFNSAIQSVQATWKANLEQLNIDVINAATGASGGVSNLVDTFIVSDSDDNGSGVTTFRIGNTNVMVISNDKKVGIGVDDPQFLVDVRGAISEVGLAVLAPFVSAGDWVGMHFGNDSVTDYKKGAILYEAIIGSEVVGNMHLALAGTGSGNATLADAKLTVNYLGEVQFPAYGAGNLTTDASGNITAVVLVEDTIADGEVGKAPSQNAVFDALALKASLTQLALKAPLESPVLTGNPVAPTQAATDNSTRVATTAFVTDRLALLDIFRLKGAITDANTNPDWPAADAGDVWVITTTSGKMGGAAGQEVDINDTLLCIVDGSPSGDDATVGANWVIGQVNLQPDLYALLTGATFTGQVELSLTDGGFLNARLTTIQKDAIVTPSIGLQIYDLDLQDLQVFKPTAAIPTGAWQSVGGGPSLGEGSVIRINPDQINENLTMDTGNNGSTIGPVTIGSGFAVTISTGARWVII